MYVKCLDYCWACVMYVVAMMAVVLLIDISEEYGFG